MPDPNLKYVHIEGKTYTLFGNSDTTTSYYYTVKKLADKALAIEPDKEALLSLICKNSSRKKYLRKIKNQNETDDKLSHLIHQITPELEPYTQKTKEHLDQLSILKFRDKRLKTSREQYHLYMLEAEITNRLYKNLFLNSDKKIALLPHCLRDLSVNCKAAAKDSDYACKQCSRACYQSRVSELLKSNLTEPYIWMGGKIKSKAKSVTNKGKTFGILGIACIPELVWGMRKCRKYNIPVVGLALNANRCSRWFGKFYPNSVDLEELKTLLSSD